MTQSSPTFLTRSRAFWFALSVAACSSNSGGPSFTPATGGTGASGGTAGAGGHAPVCATGQVRCATGCADPSSNQANCGSCGTACSTGTACVNGSCQCQTGLVQCSGTCVDTQSSAANCGACGNACSAGSVCSQGQCQSSCGTGLTQCGTDCVDLATSVAHCGSCTAVCGAGQACTNQVCTCTNAQQKLCAGSCVDVQSDSANCGDCGVSCGTNACNAGVCATGSGGSGGTGGAGGSAGALTGGTGGTSTGGTGTGGCTGTTIEGETMTPSGTGVGQAQGTYFDLWANGSISATASFAGAQTITVYAAGTAADASHNPHFVLQVNGAAIGNATVTPGTTFNPYVFDTTASGSQTLAVQFDNDFYDSTTGADTNLYVDKVVIGCGTSGTGGTATGGTGGTTGGTGGTATGGTGGTTGGTGGTATGGTGGTGGTNTCGGGTSSSSDVVVTLSSLQQKISGFGASTAWGSTMSTADADTLWSTTTGAGLSLHRIRIAPDATTSETNIAKLAVARGVTVWATPWTPNAAYKSNNNTVGGTLTNGQAFAQSLVSFVNSMKNAGVNIYAVSAQNEPDANVTYESCSYTGATMASFIGTYMGPALNGTGVKIMAPETQNWCGFPNFEPTLLADSKASPFISIIATHEYGCSPKAYPEIQQAGKEFWETEIYDTVNTTADPGMGSALRIAKLIHDALTIANMNAWHYWWVYPASNDNGALWDKPTGKPSKRLWVEGNYSRFVRPGFRRVSTSGSVPSGVLLTAYTNSSDGTVVVVAINNNTSSTPLSVFLSGTAPCSVTPWVTSSSDSLASKTAMSVNGSRFTATLAAQSVTTFVGKP